MELHDWTAFKQGGPLLHQTTEKPLFRILLEAEPGQIKRHQYRKVCTYLQNERS